MLIEGSALTLSQGTGIATYARNLNEAVRAAGYSTSVLVNVRTPLDRRDPTLNEISFFDAIPTRSSTFAQQLPLTQRLRGIGRRLIGSPFGIKATELRRSGLVVDFAPPVVTGFDHMYGALHLMEAAHNHFVRYGRRAKLRMTENISLFHATRPIALCLAGCPNIYTVHDIIPLRLPFTTLTGKRYFLQLMRHLCKTADHIVTVSEHSRRDIMQFFGVSEDRVTNTYQAINIPRRFLDTSLDQVAGMIANAFELDYEDYFLFVGAIEPKKNLSRLIDAYAASGTKRPLVIAGGLGWQYESDVEKIKDERFLRYQLAQNVISPRRQIRHLSYVPFEQLVALIRGARALLFPSLYEGFGLPVLEAMQLGAPVMTSNVASLPEVAGDAAVLVDPLDIGDMARAIKTLDDDGDLRAELRARGRERALRFSPEKYRERVTELYRRLLG
jgi:glycosyltransferase involved in cell wall biosynthesis